MTLSQSFSVGRAGLLAAVVVCLPCSAELRLELDGSARELEAGKAGQKVVLWLENTGSEAIPVLGGTLQFQIGEGIGEVGGPRITGLQLTDQPGSLFRTDNAGVTTIEHSPWMWTALVITVPESLPTEVWIPPFQRLPIATAILDATGVSGPVQGWKVRLVGTAVGDSLFDRIDPSDRGVVVPIPASTGPEDLVLGLAVRTPVLRMGHSEGGGMAFEFPVPNTREVHLERCGSLGQEAWRRVEATARSVGGVLRWELPEDEGSTQGFYRVVVSSR